MFNLNQAIQQWCELVLSNDSIKSKNIDELIDHLHCEVEQFIKNGKSEEQAFKAAIEKMGEIDMLAGEYEKNRSFLQKLCAFEYGTVGQNTNQNKTKSNILSQSILWASAMIASALIITNEKEAFSVIFLVLLPLSLANIIALRKYNKKNKN